MEPRNIGQFSPLEGITRIFSDWFDFYTGLSTIRSSHKILIYVFAEVSDRSSFSSVF